MVEECKCNCHSTKIGEWERIKVYHNGVPCCTMCTYCGKKIPLGLMNAHINEEHDIYKIKKDDNE